MKNQHILSMLLFVLLLGAMSSCKAPAAYQKSLVTFSQGAELEMRERYREVAATLPANFANLDQLYPATGAIDPRLTAEKCYEEASKAAATALKGEAQLRKLNVLDNTYAIQALIFWRQEKYAAAKTTASKAEPLLEEDKGDENDRRDLAMMQALPGLINLDLAYGALEKAIELGKTLLATTNPAEQAAIYQQLKNSYQQFATSEADGAPSVVRALTLLDRATAAAGEEQAVKLYLLNSQLAGLDTWGDLLVATFNAARRSEAPSTDLEWISGERTRYEASVTAHLAKLANSLPDGKNNKLYIYWKQVL